uniref:Putative secreted protein n=1 Tax=Anopheles darlingi TaxID=43151 RepID=A0A2M4DBG6_ANODA
MSFLLVVPPTHQLLSGALSSFYLLLGVVRLAVRGKCHSFHLPTQPCLSPSAVLFGTPAGTLDGVRQQPTDEQSLE